jgi:large subunit ribosomal protein L14e
VLLANGHCSGRALQPKLQLRLLLTSSPHQPRPTSTTRLLLPPRVPFRPQALVDGPENLTGVRRQVINFKWLSLTDFVLPVARNARQKTLTAAWKKADIQKKWEATSWAKRVAARKARAAQTDLDRFKTKLVKQRVAKAVRAKLAA